MRRNRRTAAPGRESVGAVVLGGDYRALGVVRSLGRRGIPVWVVRLEDDHRLAALSRYSSREIVLPAASDDERRRDQLLELGRRHSLDGWVLFATADPTVAFVAREHEALGDCFRLTAPPWEQFRWAYDKRCTAELAAKLDVPHPWTCPVPSRDDVAQYSGPFPVLLKPATRTFWGPAEKAWRMDDRPALLGGFDKAAAVTEPGSLMLQELLPGTTRVQYSFAALCHDGRAVASVTVERVRQYPLDFGRFSTYVETIDDPEVELLGRRVLEGLGISGLAEVEFKRDSRNGCLRLLDINVRVWGWHTIARRAGLDFPYLAWRQALGQDVDELQAPAGLRWLRLTTDVPAGVRAIAAGQLSVRDYLRTLLGRHEQPVLARDDLLPALSELPLHGLEVIRRRSARARAAGTACAPSPAAAHTDPNLGIDPAPMSSGRRWRRSRSVGQEVLIGAGP